MIPQALADVLAELSGGTGHVEAGLAVVDIGSHVWLTAATAARDTSGVELRFFDLLTAVDLDPASPAVPRLQVVLHLWSRPHRHHAVLRTEVAGDPPQLDSLAGVFPGADWAEREVHEMFGLVPVGHPGLEPLLLPDGFAGVHPLRKSFVLASRVVREWPGTKEPGGVATKRPQVPLGVPAPGTWGSDPGQPSP